jgi:hypothetical protein
MVSLFPAVGHVSGAGDIRRCRAACERLVLLGDVAEGGALSSSWMAGDGISGIDDAYGMSSQAAERAASQRDRERRDLAVILMHEGELSAAMAELGKYMEVCWPLMCFTYVYKFTRFSVSAVNVALIRPFFATSRVRTSRKRRRGWTRRCVSR